MATSEVIFPPKLSNLKKKKKVTVIVAISGPIRKNGAITGQQEDLGDSHLQST